MTQVWPAVFKTVIIQRQKLEVGSFRIKNQSAPLVLWIIFIITERVVTETFFWNSTKKISESSRVICVYETKKLIAGSRIILDKLLYSWFRASWFVVLIRSDKMQQYAGIYLLKVYSVCFGRPSHPSLGVQNTVTAASGTDHSNGATTLLQLGLITPRWRKVVVQILWPAPEAAVTIFCTPDNGRDGRPKHVEWFCSK